MPYGTVKVDNVTFTNNSVDATTTFSGIYASITNNLTLSGTATAATFTGTTANFTNVNAQNISVTTSLSGLAITGGTAGFTTITGTTVTGTTANFVTISGTTVTGTTANFVTVSGTTVTGNTGQFTNLAGAAAGFTTVTGTTITGTTANFVSGVFTTRISGTTVTGTTASFTSGVFASLSGTTHTITSGVFALGTAALPSISFVSDPNTGIYSPGADQVAVATNGTGRLFVDGNGQVSVVSAATTTTNLTVNGAASFSASSNWNFPGLLLRRTASNIAIAKQISFLLDGDTENDTTLTNYLNIWGTYSGPPTTSSTSTGLSASMNLGAPNAFIAHTNGSERLRITSTGLVGIGTSSPDVGLHYRGDTPKLRIESSNTLDTVAGTEEIGRLEWEGFRNTNFNAAASIRARQDGTWSTTTAWLAPSALEFYTQNNTGVEVTTPRMLIDSAGLVGIGTTSPGARLEVAEATAGVGISLLSSDLNGAGSIGTTNEASTANGILINASRGGGKILFQTGSTERARIDSSGRLLVGTSTARSTWFAATLTPQIQIEGASANTSSLSLLRTDANSSGARIALGQLNGGSVSLENYTAGEITFQANDGTNLLRAAGISALVDGTPGTNDMPGRLVFSTTADGASSPTERMRIKQTGSISCYQTGADALVLRSSQIAGTTNKLITALHSGTAVDTGGTASFFVYTNGNVENTNNSYGAISDLKLKENIVDATSQWSDIKALQVRKYNFKEGQTHTQIGLVAQEVELVSPGLVTESPDRDEEGNDLGTVTKSVNYSVLYMKAVKALQEAMERIEQLETEMAAVKAQLS